MKLNYNIKKLFPYLCKYKEKKKKEEQEKNKKKITRAILLIER